MDNTPLRLLDGQHLTEVALDMDAGTAPAAGIIATIIGLLSFGAFGVLWLLIFGVSVAGVVLWIVMLVDVVRRQFPDDNTKLMWVLIIVLAGWIGALIYYFVGRKQGYIPGPGQMPVQGPPPG